MTYEIHFRDGHRAKNTEWIEAAHGQVMRVDVYFGASHIGNANREPYETREPGPEAKQLQRLVGTWAVPGENAAAAPDQPGTRVDGEETYAQMQAESSCAASSCTGSKAASTPAPASSASSPSAAA